MELSRFWIYKQKRWKHHFEDLESGKPLSFNQLELFDQVGFTQLLSPDDDKFLVSGTDDKCIFIHDLETEKQCQKIADAHSGITVYNI